MISFNHIAALSSSHFCVAATLDDDDENDICRTIFVEFHAGKWRHWELRTRIIALVAGDNGGAELLALGFDGSAYFFDGTEPKWEQIAFDENSPSTLRRLTCASYVAPYFVAAGMGRQVFASRGGGQSWQRLDDDILIRLGQREVDGFFGIHGHSLDELYASGMHGHIWERNRGHWTPIDLPSNLNMMAIQVLSDGDVLVGGQRGVLLKGRHDSWKVIDHHAFADSIVDICRFREQIILSTENGALYCLVDENIIPLVDKTSDLAPIFGIDSKQDLLFAVGGDGIYIYDGRKWKKVNQAV